MLPLLALRWILIVCLDVAAQLHAAKLVIIGLQTKSHVPLGFDDTTRLQRRPASENWEESSLGFYELGCYSPSLTLLSMPVIASSWLGC